MNTKIIRPKELPVVLVEPYPPNSGALRIFFLVFLDRIFRQKPSSDVPMNACRQSVPSELLNQSLQLLEHAFCSTKSVQAGWQAQHTHIYIAHSIFVLNFAFTIVDNFAWNFPSQSVPVSELIVPDDLFLLRPEIRHFLSSFFFRNEYCRSVLSSAVPGNNGVTAFERTAISSVQCSAVLAASCMQVDWIRSFQSLDCAASYFVLTSIAVTVLYCLLSLLHSWLLVECVSPPCAQRVGLPTCRFRVNPIFGSFLWTLQCYSLVGSCW